MQIAYLMNTYPLISTTFIVREIEALERSGFDIARYAFRSWDGELVDSSDLAEAERTDYLLHDGALRLGLGFLRETLKNFGGVRKAARLWWRLWRNGGGLVRHVAYFLEAVALRQRFRAAPVTHIHAHFSTNAAAVAMLVRAMGGPGYSFTVHGPDELFNPEQNSLGLKIEHATFVSCISHFCRSQCMIFAPPHTWDRLRIVHCGVRPADFANPPAKELLPKGEGARILYVARLSQLKGGLVLMEAMAELAQDHPEVDLVVIGDGEMRAPMEAAARDHDLAGQVHFLGFKDRDTVRAALADADIFTLPSFAEGVPVSLMEAMASRRPVVTTQIAGVSELVTDGINGRIIPPGDATALAQALSEFISQPEMRDKMGADGQRVVQQEFNIDKEAAWLGTLIAAAGSGTDLPTTLRPAAQEASSC